MSNDILKILNRQVIGDEYKLKVGTLVYVIDYLQSKNPHSILSSLARVTHISEGGRNYQLRLLNNKSITRHLFSLVPTNCNTYKTQSNQTIDIFCLPTVGDTIIPNLTKSKFDSYINSFNLSKSDPPQNDIDQVMPVSDIKQNTACFVSSRTRGPVDDDIVRLSCLNENVQSVSIPEHVPSQAHDPQPKEDLQVSNLQKLCDEQQVVRPGELGKNLSLPPVHYNKAKMKQSKKDLKKQPIKKSYIL